MKSSDSCSARPLTISVGSYRWSLQLGEGSSGKWLQATGGRVAGLFDSPGVAPKGADFQALRAQRGARCMELGKRGGTQVGMRTRSKTCRCFGAGCAALTSDSAVTSQRT